MKKHKKSNANASLSGIQSNDLFVKKSRNDLAEALFHLAGGGRARENKNNNDLLVQKSPTDLAESSAVRLAQEVSSGRVSISHLGASQEGSNACAGIAVYIAFARSRLPKLSNELIEYASTDMGREMKIEVCLGQNLTPDSFISFDQLLNMIPSEDKQQQEYMYGNIYDRKDRNALLNRLRGTGGVGIGERSVCSL